MILVFVETTVNGVSELSQEAVTFARGVAGGDLLHAVVAGPLADGVAAELGSLGVSVLHHADDPRLAAYSGAAVGSVLAQATSVAGADVVVAAASPRGNEVLAHAAARLDAPMAANVLGVVSREPFTVSRQVMGGAAVEVATLEGPARLVSMAGHAVDAKPADVAVVPETRSFTPDLADADLRARVVRTEVDASGGSALPDARVVVGAGRGVGGADRFADVEDLAAALGGVIGVSRVVTSLGWRPHHEQVGQTGTRISPDVYIACGISGAIQHWAGCSSAKTILAINTDPEAPMVTRAHFAVIGDMHEVVPAITEEIKRRRSG